MSPHRLLAVTNPGAWFVVAGAIAGAVTGFHGVAFAILLVVMLLDLLTGTTRATVNPEEKFDGAVAFAGLKSKGRRVALVLVAFSADAMLIALSNITGKAEDMAGHCLISGAAIFAQYVTEGYSVLDNVRRTEGDGVGLIGRVLTAAFEGGLRRFDITRHEEKYGTPPPARRAYDQEPAEVAKVVAEETRRDGAPAPPAGTEGGP